MNLNARLTNTATELLDAATTKDRDALLAALNYSYGILSIIGDWFHEQQDAKAGHLASAEASTEDLAAAALTQVDNIHRFLRVNSSPHILDELLV